MSEPVRVAVAVEGSTDSIVLEAILCAMLPDRDFVLDMLRPDLSAAFTSPDMSGGWGGVYHWCRQAAMEGRGSISGSAVLRHNDLVIVHVDADVAGKDYASAGIRDYPSKDLPCARPCPPPGDTTNALREVVLRWLGEPAGLGKLVLCIPSMNMGAWVVAAVWEDNPMVQRSDWECRSNPEDQLGQLPLDTRFRKSQEDYRRKLPLMAAGWPQVADRLEEARRLAGELRTATVAG